MCLSGTPHEQVLKLELVISDTNSYPHGSSLFDGIVTIRITSKNKVGKQSQKNIYIVTDAIANRRAQKNRTIRSARATRKNEMIKNKQKISNIIKRLRLNVRTVWLVKFHQPVLNLTNVTTMCNCVHTPPLSGL